MSTLYTLYMYIISVIYKISSSSSRFQLFQFQVTVCVSVCSVHFAVCRVVRGSEFCAYSFLLFAPPALAHASAPCAASTRVALPAPSATAPRA